MIQINFPLSPHIFKYLSKKQGENLSIADRGLFVLILKDLLRQRTINSKVTKPKNAMEYPVTITEEWLYENSSVIRINRRTINSFDNRIDMIFRQELISHCGIYADNEPKLINRVRVFLEYYDIQPEDVNIQSLMRYLRRNGMKKNSSFQA